jgi:hypothetical protein
MTQSTADTITIDLSDFNMDTSSVITSQASTLSISPGSTLDKMQIAHGAITSGTTSLSSIYSPTGNVSIEGELKVDGVDVMQSIKDIQRVLGVVSRDLDKEEKYKGLKRAAEAYERELAKIETFETLKESK